MLERVPGNSQRRSPKQHQ